MDSVDPQLLIAWAMVAASLGLILYLFATWPAAARGVGQGRAQGAAGGIAAWDGGGAAAPARNGKATGGTAASGTAGHRQARGAWTRESLDDVIQLSGWEPVPQTAGSGVSKASAGTPRRKHKSPVTLKQRIICAGIYNKRGVWKFHVARVVVCLTMLGVGPLVAFFGALPMEHGLIISGLTGLAGYLAPSLWLDHRLRVRQTQMRRALPDALDLIIVCMQGGLSLPAALARVSRELGTAHPMLATELAIVERETQMGRGTGEAMRQFANRFSLEELRSLSSVISQAEKFGGSITGALRTYAGGLRVKRRQHAEELAQKAAVKLLFPTLLCIFPGIFVVILGPTAIRVYQVMVENPWGN